MALVAVLSLTACRQPSPAAVAARTWAEGPVRWLLLPEEVLRLEAIDTSSELTAFLQEFWSRRDPDPEMPGNPCLETFQGRVEDADRLYAEGDLRGSLSDRGGALLLLGPPEVLRHAQTRVPTLTRQRGTRLSGRPTRVAHLEVWEYRHQQLPAQLSRRLADEALERPGGVSSGSASTSPDTAPGVTLTFVAERRTTRLLHGREILELAARAAAHAL